MTNNNQEDDHFIPSITDHEISSKRQYTNNTQDYEDLDLSRKRHHTTIDHHQRDEEDDGDNGFDLTLSLSFRPYIPKTSLKPQLSLSPPPKTPSPPPLPPQEIAIPPQNLISQTTPTPSPLQLSASHPLVTTDPSSFYTITSPPLSPFPNPIPSTPSRAPRVRRNPTQAPREGKKDTVPPPFPWATDRRATVHSLKYLISNQIGTITGLVQCKRCEKQYEMGFNLKQKFLEVGLFIEENKNFMHHRAPVCWMTPVLPACQYCEQENSAKPVLADKKKEINWLFLLLGQMVGICTLDQLKYFCKHTKNHRTGAKDRVLYLTYLGLCKQLDPTGPFDR